MEANAPSAPARRSAATAGEAADSVEASNLEQIERLNQRGGRTLSAVDLVAAGTLTAEMAGLSAAAMLRGASILTGAVPGGAGKTTLMASLLGFLAHGRRIVTVENPGDVARAAGESPPPLHLVHEIGSGPWYGYLWGPAVADYLALARGPGSIASCLHADTVGELRAKLASGELMVREEDIARVGLILFIGVERSRSGGLVRRVATLNVPAGRSHAAAYAWDGASSSFVRGDAGVEALAELLGARPVEFLELAREASALIERLARAHVTAFGEVRRGLLESGLK